MTEAEQSFPQTIRDPRISLLEDLSDDLLYLLALQ